jgi:LmbE family N-acetylglucosaminyl deacetylase
MKALKLTRPGDRLCVLCLGAHSDDIEIGAGGTILSWIAEGIDLDVHWCVLSAVGERAGEAQASAEAFLAGVARKTIELAEFKDGFYPYRGEEVKAWMEGLKGRVTPDVVLTHRRDDAHQDHREVCRLTWNSFRDHLVLEYEVPKWDGDMGQPNLYVPLEVAVLERKIDLLMTHFGTQRSKDWFDPDTFRGLARLRGVECRAPSGYAEAFVARKASLSLA